MPQKTLFKVKKLIKFTYLFEAIIIPFALIYMWIITSKQGWVMVNFRYGGETVYYNFYNYILAIIVIPITIGNIKKYLTIRKCKIVFADNEINLYTLKRKYITPKQKKV